MKPHFIFFLLLFSLLCFTAAEGPFMRGGSSSPRSESSTKSLAGFPAQQQKAHGSKEEARTRFLRRQETESAYVKGSDIHFHPPRPVESEMYIPPNGLANPTTAAVMADPVLVYVGPAKLLVEGQAGFSCRDMNDDEIDAKLDAACDSLYPGSRNIRGTDIENGLVAEILNLPDNPQSGFIPSCPGCGSTCAKDDTRRCNLFDADWNIHGPFWVNCEGGSAVIAECVISRCRGQ